MNKETFTSPLASHMQRFLEFKRAAGYGYLAREWEMKDFDKFLMSYLGPNPVITDAVIRAYVTLTGKRVMNRLSLLRHFAVLWPPKTRGLLSLLGAFSAFVRDPLCLAS